MIQVFIGPSREHAIAFGIRVAAPTAISALIDTGAASSVITAETAGLLGLQAVGVARIQTPTTIEAVLCRQYYVNIYFSEMFAVEDILATEAPLTGQAVQCLIGRDILSRGVFTYSGVDNLFRLAF